MDIPKSIGRYSVRGVLGSGGFATVFHAEDEALDDEVAIKVLADNWAYDPDIRARFIAEARLVRSVDCEQVIRVHDIGEADGRPYFVMDLAERGTLAERVEQVGLPLALEDVRRVAHTLSLALYSLHAAGVVHRDIKPSNLLLRRRRRMPGDPDATVLAGRDLIRHDERLLLGDLGLAKDLTAASGITMNAGTPGFHSPEQVTPGQSVDHRADVWAASAVVCALITGRPPVGMDERALDEEQRQQLGGAAPAVLRGLRVDPDERPGGIGDWYREVDHGLRLLDGGAGETRLAGSPPATESPTPLTGSAPVSDAVSGGVAGPDSTDQDLVTLDGEAHQSSRSRSSRHLLPWAAAVAALLLGIAAWVVLAGGDDDPPIVGPDEIPVGATGVFTADLTGLDDSIDPSAVTITWIDWNGRVIVDDAFSVRPTGAGRLDFRMRADTAGETVLDAEHHVTVVEAADHDSFVIGSDEIPVGATGIFTADLTGLDAGVNETNVVVMWTDWTGRVITDESFFVRPTAAGRLDYSIDISEAGRTLVSDDRSVRAVD